MVSVLSIMAVDDMNGVNLQSANAGDEKEIKNHVNIPNIHPACLLFVQTYLFRGEAPLFDGLYLCDYGCWQHDRFAKR